MDKRSSQKGTTRPMSKAVLRKTVARNASFTLLTVALLLACSCSRSGTGFQPVKNTAKMAVPQREGWDLVPEVLSRIVPPTFPNRDFNVTDYGAAGDGVTDCSKAFKKAIAACTKAGGGRVVVPKGVFLSNGPIHLDNNVNLHVTKDAIIRFGTNFDDYLPHVRVRWEGTECYNYSPLIYAYKKTNIAITGSGTLNGQAESSWVTWGGKEKPGTTPNEVLRQMGNDLVPVEKRKFYLKPTMIEPFECKNVLIEGVTLNDYPFWCVHPTFCTNVTIRNLTIDSHNSNNDGLDPDSCKDVLIESCYLDQSDDSLAIKAGRDRDAWRAGKPCENIIIRNMSVWDGVAIGSECSGGVRNVFVENCTIQGTTMLYCKSNLDRGGFIENIWLRNIKGDKSGHVLRLRNNYHGYRGGNSPTRFRNIHLDNVTIKEAGKAAISITGVKEAHVEDVFLKNVTIGKVDIPTEIQYVDNIEFANVNINGELQPVHPKQIHPTPEKAATQAGSGTPSITALRTGNWSDTSIWDADWDGRPDGRLPNGTKDERVLIGGSKYRAKVTVDMDIDDVFQVRIYENSTLIIPSGRTFKLNGENGEFRPDRKNSRVRQTGGTVDVDRYIRIDDPASQYLITGGSIRIGDVLRIDEGELIIDDSSAAITSISVAGAFQTGEGDGDTTTKFITHSGGVTPIQCKDVQLLSYTGETLIVDVTNYDYAKNGDLVLFSYTGTRTGEFDNGSGTPQVTIIGARADLVYDDAGKKIKLTSFRP